MKLKIILCVFCFLGTCFIGHRLISMPIASGDLQPVPPSDAPPLEAAPPATVPPPDAAAPAPVPPPAGGPTPAAVLGGADGAPAAPTAPDIQPEQLKGPDILELSEEKKGLVATSNKQIIATFKDAENVTTQASDVLNTMAKTYDDTSKKFDDINTQIDSFFQDTAFSEGKVEEQVAGK